MKRIAELRAALDAARDPGPWIRPWESYYIHGMSGRHVLSWQENLDLAVAAVNALPVLLDIAEAAADLASYHVKETPGICEEDLFRALNRLAGIEDDDAEERDPAAVWNTVGYS